MLPAFGLPTADEPAPFERPPGLGDHRALELGAAVPASYMPDTMDPDKTTLERAFEIAATGAPTNVADIRAQLRAEGYDSQKIEGRSLIAQLRRILEKAKADAHRP